MAELRIGLPSWIDELVREHGRIPDDDEARMALAIELGRRNVEDGNGPFGAVVFAGEQLIAAGVNRVLDSGFSIAHAEILALMGADQRSSVAAPRQPYCLVTSTEPCCQCFGALIWSGATRLVCGATTADAEAVGFDEGPKPENWPGVLEARGISVKLGVRRSEARAVLEEYRRRGGTIYGPRSR